jgi:ribulose-phosphate 3-epimerase
MVKIAPSILSVDFSQLGDQIRAAETGGADWIHLDIMDGHFVPNLTFGPVVIKGIRRLTALPLDAHLMVSDPVPYLDSLKESGVDHITVHVEASMHLWRTLDHIQKLGLKAGVTLNPATSIHLLEPVLHRVHQVLVMSVEPGFEGQSFIEESIERIQVLDQLKQTRGYSYLIQVDGGIDKQTASKVVQAGAQVLVAGSSIFHQSSIETAVRSLRAAAQS